MSEGARRQDTPAPGAIQDKRAETVVQNSLGRLESYALNVSAAGGKGANAFDQFCRVLQRRPPERGDVPVQIYHQGLIRQFLHDGRQCHDPASGERLDEYVDRIRQPLSDMGHEPRFPAWVAEWAALRYAGHVGRRDG